MKDFRHAAAQPRIGRSRLRLAHRAPNEHLRGIFLRDSERPSQFGESNHALAAEHGHCAVPIVPLFTRYKPNIGSIRNGMEKVAPDFGLCAF